MGLLHSSGGGSALPGCLGSELLPRSLSSGRFTSGLLSTSHVSLKEIKVHLIINISELLLTEHTSQAE